MAVSNSSINQYSSLTQDSDAVEEMYCENCEKDKYVPAEGFCVNCVEYMCGTCLRYHKLYMASHTLQDKNGMPQDFCFEKCDVHKNQLIKFFCSNCQKTACSECTVKDHKDCSNVKHFPSLVPGVEKSKELTDLFESIELLSKEVNKTDIRIGSNIHHISSEETKALVTIQKHKEEVMATYKKHQKEIIDTFDKKMEETIAKLKKERENVVKQVAEKQKKFEDKFEHSENETIRKVKTSKNSDNAKLQSLKDTNLKIKTYLNSASSDLAVKKNLGQRCKIFLAMKKTQPFVEKLKLDSKNVNENTENYRNKYIVTPEIKLLDAETLENKDEFFQFEEIPSSRRKRTAKYKHDLNIKYVGGSSLCLLSDNILLMTCYDRKSLLIYQNMNVNAKRYDTERLKSKPWSITKVEDNKAAVTFPNEGIVRLITFSESTTVISTDDRSITVGKRCHGIAYSNNNLIVSYNTNPGKVQMLDMSGNVLKCFDKDCNDQPLFSDPHYLTLSPDNTTIYVSDFERYTVTSLTLDGHVKAIYRNDQLSKPHQMTVDESGTVYVCGVWSHNVHQLASDLTKVKILLDKGQGMGRPMSAAYCQKNNILYVGMYDSSIIKVFDISL